MQCSLPGSFVHGFSEHEHWSGLSCLTPGDLPDPGIELMSLASPALASWLFTTITTWKVPNFSIDEFELFKTVFFFFQFQTHFKLPSHVNIMTGSRGRCNEEALPSTPGWWLRAVSI